MSELRDLYSYNRWAHEKTLDAAGQLGPEKFAADNATSKSLRLALQTMLSDEVVWLSRWEGHSLAEIPDYSECHDTSALTERWKSLWKRQQRFIESLTEDDLGTPIAIRMRNGIETVQMLGDTLTHVVNSATSLRGEAGVLIRQLGGTSPGADLFSYRLENGEDGSDSAIVP